MILLSGFKYPEDIDIQFSGLRPGEKLYEELLTAGEDLQKTYHKKIMIAKTQGLVLSDKVKCTTCVVFRVDCYGRSKEAEREPTGLPYLSTVGRGRSRQNECNSYH